MQICEQLKQLKGMKELINLKKNEISKLEELLDITGIDYSKEKIKVNPGNAKFTNTIDQIVCLEEDLKIEIDKFVTAEKEVSRAISSINDTREKLVLYKKYFDFATFDEIAVDLDLSKSRVFHIHRNALQKLSKI